MPEPTERTALYRYFDVNRDLLYVGISVDPDERWKQHRYSSRTWPALVSYRTDQWIDSRWEAEEAEIETIKIEKPRFNGAHNFTEAPIDSVDWPRFRGSQSGAASYLACLLRGEIMTGRWLAGQKLPPLARIAERIATGRKAASLAAAKIEEESLIEFRWGRGFFVCPVAPRRPIVGVTLYEAIHGHPHGPATP
jgi:hypothetical protein